MFRFFASITQNRDIRASATSARSAGSSSAGNRRNAQRVNAMLDRIGRQEDRG